MGEKIIRKNKKKSKKNQFNEATSEKNTLSMQTIRTSAILFSLLLPRIVRMASVFVTHGGGPMPLIHKEEHALMYKQFQDIEKRFPNPKAIILFSAHWEQNDWTMIDYDSPPHYYDYYGFPPQTYNLTYPIRSNADVRNRVKEHLKGEGINLKSDLKRGYDHGVFIPLMLMYPKANVPIIQISLLKSLSPEAHYRMGVALRGLKKQGFLILGSGASVHGGFGRQQSVELSKVFDGELAKLVMSDQYSSDKLLEQVKGWRNLKHSKYFHPREEHLVPLFVNLGAYEGEYREQMKLFIMGVHLSNFILN